MAERRASRAAFEVYLDYTCDRLRESKLAQAYDILVPGRERLIGARTKETEHEDGSRNDCLLIFCGLYLLSCFEVELNRFLVPIDG